MSPAPLKIRAQFVGNISRIETCCESTSRQSWPCAWIPPARRGPPRHWKLRTQAVRAGSYPQTRPAQTALGRLAWLSRGGRKILSCRRKQAYKHSRYTPYSVPPIFNHFAGSFDDAAAEGRVTWEGVGQLSYGAGLDGSDM
ncbi:hypothetical protein CYMTET_37999 [Cymbomonas tetramitiformis]|uniref:Uncharacterized protein n=1 Tax=Cymbomonas tetramitiformis TaxID=36881 RepID=A0AAE0CF55_9CHLO|nr:hypothetical protein CYMTET_37999 [Cymbomonas tetramitiformis]